MSTSHDPQLLHELQLLVTRLVGPLPFGKVELLFHQGKLVQIEKTEKIRFDERAAKDPLP